MSLTETLADGRRRRSEESRRRIVDAMLALLREGHLAPTAESVAARSGVGLRTVFRHFADMETLHRDVTAIMTGRLLPITAEPFRAETWQGRVEELIERRVRIFEEMLPLKRAADIYRARSPFLNAQQAELARFQRDVLQGIVPSDVFRAGRAAFEALDLAICVDSWRRLRDVQQLGVEQARQVMLFSARAIIAAAAAAAAA